MKSGLDLLKEIYEKIEELNRRYAVLEQKMDLILNRANGFAPSTQTSQVMINDQPVSIKGTTPTPDAPSIKVGPERPKLSPKNMARVTAKIKDESNRALIGVRVRVFNDKNQVVKETKTNRAGEWNSFLPPGNYGAEYFLNEVINANVNFVVETKVKVVRVGG